MFTVSIYNCIFNTKKLALTFSMTTILVISSISFLFQINNLENVDAVTVIDIDPLLQQNLVGGGGKIVESGTAATKAVPTFNPMFSTCDQSSTFTEAQKANPPSNTIYKWEVAKYAITAELGDKDKLKSKDFSLDIFADIVNDDAQFDSKDYPYKADIKTKKGGDTSLNIKEFMTLCADIVDLQVPEKSNVNLDKSEALKELGFDS